MTPLVMSTLQYGMGTWSNYSKAVEKTAAARLTGMYRRLLRFEVPHEQLQAMSHDEVLARTQLPSFQELVHVNRLCHLGSLLREAPLPLWAMLEHEQTWLGNVRSSLMWLWDQLQTSVQTQNPLSDWPTWKELIIHTPKRWTGLIARAMKHAVLQKTLQRSSRHWHSVIVESIVRLGLRPDWLQSASSPHDSCHLCAPCQQRFKNAASWAVHAFKKHNRVHYLRYHIDHTVCKSCAKEYWSHARLHRHLRYQEERRTFYMNFVPRGVLSPGLNSKFFRQNEPPVLSPPVDAVCDVFDLHMRYGGDPEAEVHDALMCNLADLLEVDITDKPDYHDGQEGITMWSLVAMVRACLCEFPIPFRQIELTWRLFFAGWQELVPEDAICTKLLIWKHTFNVVQWRFCAAWLVPLPPQLVRPNDHRDAPYHWLMSDPVFNWEQPKLHVPRVMPERFVVHFFSGRRRPDDLQAKLEALPVVSGCVLHVLSVDLVYGEKADLLQSSHRKRWLNIFASGVALAFWAGPPCESRSTARHNKLEHSRVRLVRSAVFPWGLPASALWHA